MPKKKQADVKPQFFRMPFLEESAANTFTENSKTTPVVSSLGENRSLVMELLKIFALITSPPLIVTDQNNVSYHLADRTFSTMKGYSTAGVIMAEILDSKVIGAGIEGGFSPPRLHIVDLSDGAGNGILFGGPTLYQAIEGDPSNNVTSAAEAAILFRLIEVTASEYAQSLQFA